VGRLLVLLLLASLVSCAPQTLPDLQISRLDGTPFRTSELRGRAAWLEFWSPWDPASLQRLQELPGIVQNIPHLREKVALVAVVVAGTPEEAKVALNRFPGLPFTVVLDSGSLGESLGVQVAPTTVWLDPDGRSHRLCQGYVEPESLARKVAPLLDEAQRPGLP